MLGFKNIYEFFITFIASIFGVAVASGVIDKFLGMFTVLVIYSLTILAIRYIALVMDRKATFEGKSIGDIILKLSVPAIEVCSVLVLFIILSATSVIVTSIDNIFYYIFYSITWAYTGVITSVYLIQILTFGKRIGLPGMATLIEIVENLSGIFIKRFKK